MNSKSDTHRNMMKCKVTLSDDNVTFEAHDFIDLVRQLNAEDTFTLQDVVKIELSQGESLEYSDNIYEYLSELKLATRGTKLKEAVDYLTFELGYSNFFTY